MAIAPRTSRAGLWVPAAIGIGAVGLTLVGLMALRNAAVVARVRAREAAGEAVAATGRALDDALARVAERVGDPVKRSELEKLALDTPGGVLAFSWSADGSLRAPAPPSKAAPAQVSAAERISVEAYLEEAAFQEHTRQDLTAAEKAIEQAGRAAVDASLRASVALAWMGYELRRGRKAEAAARVEHLLTQESASSPPVLEARAMARHVLWSAGVRRPESAGVDAWITDLTACRPDFARALLSEVLEERRLDVTRIDTVLRTIRDIERRASLVNELHKRGKDWVALATRLTSFEGFVLCMGPPGPDGRSGVAVDLTTFVERELPAASSIARAAGFPVVAGASSADWVESEPVRFSGGALRLGLPGDFDLDAVAPGFPVWASGVLVILLGASVAGGAWFLTRAARRDLAAAAAKSEFLAGVTHELKTPLAAIRLYGEMLQEGRVTPEKRQEYVATIGREAERLTQLIDRVLSLARAEQGKILTRELERVSAAEVAHGAERAFRPVAENSGNRFTMNVKDGETLVGADAPALVQAILDLLENARKYGLDGGEIELRGFVEQGHDRVRQYCFEILDRGPGLPPGDPERLFTLFARGEGDSVRGKVGLGIGLALSRRILEAQGGTLDARNREGGGAVFRIRLPIADLTIP